MKKEIYVAAELEVIQFENEDILTTSDPTPEFPIDGSEGASL